MHELSLGLKFETKLLTWYTAYWFHKIQYKLSDNNFIQ